MRQKYAPLTLSGAYALALPSTVHLVRSSLHRVQGSRCQEAVKSARENSNAKRPIKVSAKRQSVPHRGAVGKDMGGEEIRGFGMRPNGYRCNTEILHYTH